MHFTASCLSIFLIFFFSKCVDATENTDNTNKSLSFDQVLSSPQGVMDSFRDYTRTLFTQVNHEGPYATFNRDLTPNFKDEGNHFERGMEYFRKMQLKSALQEFDKTKAADPHYPNSYYYRGVSLILSDNFEEGWKDVLKAQELGFKVRPKILESLKRYAQTSDGNKASPDLENSLRKLQWEL